MRTLKDEGMDNFYFTDDDWKLLDKNRIEITYSKGETIIKQETFATHVLFIKSGLAKVMVEAENRRRLAVEVVASESYIGLPFLHTDHFLFTVEAIKETTLYQFRREAFSQVINNNTEAKHQLINRHSQDYIQLLHKLEINSTRNNHGKLAHVLYSLCSENYQEEDIFSYLTRKDLAELASISKESTNKILKELQHDCIIRISQEGIKVVKPELLKRLSMIG
jgi:CRP/FNR family transcriptional regulator